MTKEMVTSFLKTLRQQGAKIVLDSKSFSLEDIYEIQPWLIKPNQEEISEYFSCDVKTISQAREKAREFARHGIANAMISLGEQGALLIADGEAYVAKPPVISAVSTIGAGDSSIAGFLVAAHQGKSAAECLKMAVSFGTAACLTAGTLPPKPEDVRRIFDGVEMHISAE
jgi:fructose-1-phosphate kinase PfkB-like protein